MGAMDMVCAVCLQAWRIAANRFGLWRSRCWLWPLRVEAKRSARRKDPAELEWPRCARAGCSCMRGSVSKYCGSYCESMAQHPTNVCSCGHRECSDRRGLEK